MVLMKHKVRQNIPLGNSCLIFANIQGLKSNKNDKVSYVSGLLTEANAMFGAFTETHTRDVLDGEIKIENYNMYRCDRFNTSQGGVGIYIKDTFCWAEVLNCMNDIVEILGINVENRNLVIILVYKPALATAEEFTDQLSKIDSYLDRLENPTPNILLLGDFNLPRVKWKMAQGNVIPEISPGSTLAQQVHTRELMRLCERYSLNQQVIDPTRNENTLDLIFTSNEELIRDITVSKTIYCDHNIIEVQTSINSGVGNCIAKVRDGMFSKFNFNNHRIDWEKIHQELSDIPWESDMSNLNPHQCLEKLNREAYLDLEFTWREFRGSTPPRPGL
ncbi:uncharacterized protein [Cherax quadricarinatus]|uniref:uncharacterized protein isoform X1 n=1 Tax=Cherax quadricarinatus TaxID=27406 RepID=UPI00387E28D7